MHTTFRVYRETREELGSRVLAGDVRPIAELTAEGEAGTIEITLGDDCFEISPKHLLAVLAVFKYATVERERRAIAESEPCLVCGAAGGHDEGCPCTEEG